MNNNLYQYDYTGSAIRSGGRHQGDSMIWPGYAVANAKRNKADPKLEKALAPEQDGTMSEVAMLELYIGENADKFLKFHKNVGRKFAFSFNLAAFFAPMAWCFYRKLYIIGVLILILPIIVVLVFLNLADFSGITLAAIFATSVNELYLTLATRKVNALKEQATSQEELREMLLDNGGTSTAGAIFGLLITASLLAISFMSATGWL